MPSNSGFSRRHFFYGALLAGAVPAGGYGSVPALRALVYKPFYDKLNVASIGCGGQGGADLVDAARTENIVAICDVDSARAAENFKRFEKVTKYKDFRVMLDKEGKNIDACTMGIPDFMHATVALACMERGKHVYVEKPLTRTPWEARLLQDAAVKYKVATQMGNQGFSHEAIRVAAEIVWSGAIGDVTEAHFSTSAGRTGSGDARLGSVAGRGGAAAVQHRLRALQLAGVLRFRHGPDWQLGHAHGGPDPVRADVGGADQRGVRKPGRAEQHHVSEQGYHSPGLPRPRRDARGEGLLSRFVAVGGPNVLPRAGHGERNDSAAVQ